MSRKFVLALGVVAVLLGGFVIPQLFGSGARLGPVQQIARMQPQRAFAARLSIPTEYRACTAPPADTTKLVPREVCDTSDQDSPDLPALADVEESSTDPDSLRASGLAAIIWHNEKNEQALGDAILRLERAKRLSTRRAPLLVDLSAAHLVRAAWEQNPQDLIRAIDYAQEALELEPKNRSAQFNAALAMQAYGLDEEAALAWDAYLALDSTSPWADEAHRRKQDLITEPPQISFPAPGALAEEVAEFARAFPQEAREYGWNRVLGDWGAATAGGDRTRAESLLHLAEQFGRALAARTGGDVSLADAVTSIRAARSDPAATMALARAHREYAIGMDHFNELEPQAAIHAFDRVVRARPSSRVLLLWTALHQAGARYYVGETDKAERDLRALLATVDSVRHPVLKGRAGLMLGSMLLQRGNAAESRDEEIRAVAYFGRAGETENAGAALSMHGEAAYAEGGIREAYEWLHRAQLVLRHYRHSDKLHRNLHGLARSAVLDGMSRAALIILNEDLQVTGRLGTTARVIDVLQARARARTTLGDSIGAARDKDSIVALLPKLPADELLQGWVRAVIPLTKREGVSVAEMDTAVESASDHVIWLMAALIRRADLLIQTGDLSGAIKDLDSVTTRVQGSSLKPDDMLLRAAMLEQARSRFDRLVMLYLRMDQPTEALRALERGRLSFAPRDGAASTAGSRLAAPPGHVALEYALIGDTLLTWTIWGETIRIDKQPVDRDEFILTAERVTAALQSSGREADARLGLQLLYNWLIRPVRGYLGPPETPLVILADGEVAGVPFAALLDSARSQYLIEDHPLRFAATLADAARQAPARARAGHALLVADPRFAPRQYPDLYPLKSAHAEVQSLSGLYPSQVLLERDSATRDAFVQSLRGASLVHYAGHAVFDDARPERSFLVLAGAGTTGRLTAQELSEMRLDGVRLVVLSACRTLRAREGRSGGFAGFSGALLTAGAGGVVGSLWQVNDQLTNPLMVAFHEELRSRDPADALRQAQLWMLNSNNPRMSSPSAWAGFRYTGAERP